MERIIVMTEDQLQQLISSLKEKDSQKKNEAQTAKRYIYGLKGIRELFNVSHGTAQRYKNTFLKPAIIQRGRKIMVDADEALQLYNGWKG